MGGVVIRSHLVISDGQVKPGQSHKHWTALGKLVLHLKPDVIINIGDFWDMPSLSSYLTKKEYKEVSYEEDILAGNAAMEKFLDPIAKRKKGYPEMHFCMGNHEQRIQRLLDDNPHLEGKIGYQDLNLKRWITHEFRKPVNIDGVHYSHYFYNKNSGRPYAGTAHNKLNKVGFSFTQGHIQELDVARKDLANGKTIIGLVTGAYYLHDEPYKGPQGNNHWRGVVFKPNVKDGKYDLEAWSIERVMERFG